MEVNIVRELLTLQEQNTSTQNQFANYQRANPDIALTRNWVESASLPTPDELLALSSTINALAQLLPELILGNEQLQLRRADEPTRF